MTNKIYGYIRVSSKEQNEARQLIALQEAGVSSESIFTDKQSGISFNRPAYAKLIKRLNPGDLLIIKSIDRLGRNYEEILSQWRVITKEIKADIIVLDMPLLDTRTKSRDLTGTFIADLVLQILSYVAQTERDFIRQRQAEGIAAAQANGRILGRKKLPLPDGFEEICQDCLLGTSSIRESAAQLGMNPATFFRRYREWASEKGHLDKF